MEIGIIGLPQSGKTTIFNSLTRGRAHIATHSSPVAKPNVGVTKVPDPRLKTLYDIFRPEKVVQAEVAYVDPPGVPEGLAKTKGIGGEFLNHLQSADALLHVVRAFDDPSLPHSEGSVEPFRDIDTMNLELAFSDLGILERRLQRLEASLKSTRASEREVFRREELLLQRIKAQLEKDVPIRALLTLASEEAKLLGNYQFLTAKPLLIVLNISEDQASQEQALKEGLLSHVSGPGIESTVLAGKLEMELSQMKEEEEKEFRESLGAVESGLERMIRMSYQALGLISFFTVGSDEVKAWTITRGTSALKAAGKIHSDIQRGFIRAEVICFEDMVASGSLSEARTRGVLRLEGKEYIIQDGEIVTFRFNV